jgi:hypothetical protein
MTHEETRAIMRLAKIAEEQLADQERGAKFLPPTPGGRHSFDTWLLGQRRLRNRRWAIRPFQSFGLDQKFWRRGLWALVSTSKSLAQMSKPPKLAAGVVQKMTLHE